MPKKIIQDMVSKNEDSDVHSSSGTHSSSPAPRETEKPHESETFKDTRGIDSSPIFEKMKQSQDRRESLSQEFSSGRKSSKIPWVIGGVLVLGLVGAFAYGAFFGSVQVAIQQKSVTVPLDHAAFVVEDSSSSPGMAFQVATLTADDSRDLSATGEKYVEKKASGKITISNNYSTAPQRLVKNTRFQSKEGKIYRISDSVTVPGMSGSNPGQLEVTVFADLPGTEYNVGVTDFTIPGFKGSPQFAKFSAHGEGSISGGFQGKMKTVADADLAKAEQELEASVGDALWKKALAEKPEGTTVLKNVGTVTFEHSTQDSDNGNVKLVTRGTLHAGLFNTAILSRQIATRVVTVPDGEETSVENFDALQVEMKDSSVLSAPSASKIELTITGQPKVIWNIDSAKLKEALLGVKKSEYTAVFGKFPGIEKARVTFSPFWKTQFPNDPNGIILTISGDDTGAGSTAQGASLDVTP